MLVRTKFVLSPSPSPLFLILQLLSPPPLLPPPPPPLGTDSYSPVSASSYCLSYKWNVCMTVTFLMLLSSVCCVPAERGLGTVSPKQHPVKRSRDELRALWKKAINQQLLLIRMEKENARLRGTCFSLVFVIVRLVSITSLQMSGYTPMIPGQSMLSVMITFL